MRAPTALLLVLVAAAPAASQNTDSPVIASAGTVSAAAPAVLRAERLTGSAPRIDGRLDEAAWQDAQVATGFVQTRPRPGEPATLPTEVRVLYDEDAIYVAARMYDPHPDSIVAQLTRRDDQGVSDFFQLAFDSYADRRSGYVFGVNPRGVKQDAFLYDDTRSDNSWDAVWEVATRVDSLGWTAEFRIPLSQLRFNVGSAADGGKRAWGVDFKRTVGRSSEESFWAPPPKDGSKLVSIFGMLHGLGGLNPPRRLEAVPYTVEKLTRGQPDPADPFARASAWATSLGADLKYGIGANLTATATLNPDFGQVEADPSVVNLSAFESFFPEKRPFFLEGADIFRFGIGVGDGDFGNESLFYSRRIGRSPQLGVPDEADYSDVPGSVPILGALKLSGKTSGGWSIGVLDAVTGRATARYATDAGVRGRAPVEPLTNYGMARLIRSSRDGQSAVGAVFTATDRRLDAPEFRDRLAAAAYVGGLDFRHRFGHGAYQVNGWLIGSQVLGSDSAIAERQRDPTHYFQRPGATQLRYDPTRTSLGGWAASAQVGRITGAWQWGVIENVRSPGFDVNDLGFSQNGDMALTVVYGSWNLLNPWHRFRRIGVNSDVVYSASFSGEALMRVLEGNVNFDLLNNWGGGVYASHELDDISPSQLRGGPALRMPGNTHLNAWAYSDGRRRFGGDLSVNYGRQRGGAGRDLGLYPDVWLRPSSRMELSLGPGISWHRSAWQYVTDGEVAGASRYVFASLDQTTVSLTTRLNYTFSPALSFQLYAQPFVSTGAYADFKQVVDPLAATFDRRFHGLTPAELPWDAGAGQYRLGGGAGFGFDNPDFSYRDMRSNAVLRWEWRPGSTLFLVWSQQRPSDDDNGQFRLGPEVTRLFRAPATNVFLVKASYWLGS